MTRPASFLILVAALSLSGCGGTDVLVETDKVTYAPGTCVGLLLTNPALASMYVDHCGPALERETASGWERVENTSEELCLLYAMSIDGLRRGGFYSVLPVDLQAGTYRYQVGVNWGGSEYQPRDSEPFEVAGPAATANCSAGEAPAADAG